MPEEFLRLTPEEQADILQTCAAKLGRRPQHLEKDVWICWVLQNLFSMPGGLPMAFKGGTSLSKVFDAISRFSEDIDVSIDYRALDNTIDPFAPGISKTAQKKLSQILKARLKDHANKIILPYFEKLTKLHSKFEKPIELSEDGETMRIYCPTVFEKGESVLVEFGGRNVVEPSEEHAIHPYVANEVKDLVFPAAQVRVLSPSRTFWEKATLIHVECHRADPKKKADRLSRHWYDLAMLADHEIGKQSVADRELFADVVRHKKFFYYSAYAHYDACLSGGLRLVAERPLLDALEIDFKRMIEGGMFDTPPPKFEEIGKRLEALQKEINELAGC